MFFSREHTLTPFIRLDTGKCKACWKCIKNCTNKVIGKVDFAHHKHALILQPDACTGCLKCIEICDNGAFIKADNTKQKTDKLRKRTFNNFIINNLLLFFGLAIIFSGLALQFGFHMGRHGGHQTGSHEMQYEQLREIDTSKTMYGLNYSDWSATHKYVIVIFSLFMIYHTYVHWKWYKGVITKHLIHKNKQVIILSVLFLLVAVTGFIPWFIDISGSTSILRMLFIEIHDKITFILIVFFVLHFIKRANWYSKTYAKLKN